MVHTKVHILVNLAAYPFSERLSGLSAGFVLVTDAPWRRISEYPTSRDTQIVLGTEAIKNGEKRIDLIQLHFGQVI